MKRFLSLNLIFLQLTACTMMEERKNESTDKKDSLSTSDFKLSPEEEQEIENLIGSVGPPLEFTYALDDLGIEFSPGVLYPYESISSESGSLDKALLLGIVGADFVYCLVYKRNDLTNEYISEIETLCDELGLSNVIDFKNLSRLSRDGNTENDLALEFSYQMERVYNHLNSHNQLHLSAMMSFGGWIESMYIASETGRGLDEFPEEAADLIYYEAQISRTFLEIFERFSSYPGFVVPLKDLNDLKEIYSKFEVTLRKAETKVTYTNEIAQAVNLSTQTLTFTEEEMNNLISKISGIRNGLLK